MKNTISNVLHLFGEKGPEIIEITSCKDEKRRFIATDSGDYLSNGFYGDSLGYDIPARIEISKCSYCGVSSDKKFGTCPYCGAPL